MPDNSLKHRILLVSANNYRDPYPVYPLGVSYLKSAILMNAAKWDVDIADMNFISTEMLASKIRNGSYNCIGLSMRNIDDNNFRSANRFVQWYKELSGIIKANTDAILIGGGAGYSIFPVLLFKELGLDYGIKGEGEFSIVELLKIFEKYLLGGAKNKIPQNVLENVDGLVYEDDAGTAVLNGRKIYDKAPELDFEHESVDYYWKESGMLNIQTKRGCPYHCIYCSYPVIEGNTVRTLSPDKIVDSLEKLYREKKINYVFFTDSVFNICQDYNKELCSKIIERGIKISWGAYFSPSSLSAENLKLYKDSGLTHIEFGTESFSDKQLRNYGKEFTWKDILEKSAMCDDLGIFYAHFMILAGYGETQETINETLEHSKQLAGRTVIFPYFGMRIYPGTKLFEIAKSEGVVKSESELLKPVFYISRQIDTEDVRKRAYETGARWVFPDDPPQAIMKRYRERNMKGPLWEYLRYSL